MEAYIPSLSNTNYERPKITYTDTLQNKKSMKQKLKHYTRVVDIDTVPLNTHIRYVSLDKKLKQVFRTGGILIKKHSKYIKLSNGTVQWSVQRYHYRDDQVDPIFKSVFFSKNLPESARTLDEGAIDEDKYIDIIEKQHAEIQKLRTFILETHNSRST
tara:strand:+ start:7734 stop:8207 length:474 start_codon:yes stop_codon:yes gene_type:complete